MDEVQKDTGMPFEEMVKMYAGLGYTRFHTAKLLGYGSHSPFYRLCKKHGWDGWFANAKNRKGTRVYSSKHNMGSPKAVEVEWDGVTMCLAAHARRLGIPVQTVYNRYNKRPGNWVYIFDRCKHNTTNRPVKPARWRS
jgi:hypothetical protein